jgi:hypothetical protein
LSAVLEKDHLRSLLHDQAQQLVSGDHPHTIADRATFGDPPAGDRG